MEGVDGGWGEQYAVINVLEKRHGYSLHARETDPLLEVAIIRPNVLKCRILDSEYTPTGRKQGFGIVESRGTGVRKTGITPRETQAEGGIR